MAVCPGGHRRTEDDAPRGYSDEPRGTSPLLLEQTDTARVDVQRRRVQGAGVTAEELLGAYVGGTACDTLATGLVAAPPGASYTIDGTRFRIKNDGPFTQK